MPTQSLITNKLALLALAWGVDKHCGIWGSSLIFHCRKMFRGAVAISAPCSLIESAATLNLRSNKVYEQKFLVKLREKVKQKSLQFPEIDVTEMAKVKTLKQFDDLYSGPIHGFKDATEFYEFCNPYPFLKNIQVPTLLINALNDPLLQGDCYPYRLAEEMPNLYLETPKKGGHVGFIIPGSEFTYAELRALEFLNENN